MGELTKLNPQLIAIYEAGEFPSKKDNQVLASLIKSDHVLLQLINDSKTHFSPQLIAKVNAYLNHTQVKKVSQKARIYRKPACKLVRSRKLFYR